MTWCKGHTSLSRTKRVANSKPVPEFVLRLIEEGRILNLALSISLGKRCPFSEYAWLIAS